MHNAVGVDHGIVCHAPILDINHAAVDCGIGSRSTETNPETTDGERGVVRHAAIGNIEKTIIVDRGIACHAVGADIDISFVDRGVGSFTAVHHPHFTVLIDRFTVHYSRVFEQIAARTEIDAGILVDEGYVCARFNINLTA